MQSSTAQLFDQVLNGGPIPHQWKHAIRRHTVRTKADLEQVDPKKTKKQRTHAESAMLREQIYESVCSGMYYYIDIANHFDLTQRVAKNYLQKLRKQGLITVIRYGHHDFRWVKA